jgi:DNA polymerase-1
MKSEKYLSKMILQVHDELIFETRFTELEKLKILVLDEMSNAVRLDVPLKVDWGTGNNWFEAH